MDIIEDPWKNHTIEDQAGSWTTPLKIVWVQCFHKVPKRSYIFWKIDNFKEFQKQAMKI